MLLFIQNLSYFLPIDFRLRSGVYLRQTDVPIRWICGGRRHMNDLCPRTFESVSLFIAAWLGLCQKAT